MSLDALSRATTEGLAALADSPAFDQMVEEGPPNTLYVAWLRSMAVIVRELERLLDRAEVVEVRKAWHEARRALPRIAADLVVLDDVPARPTLAIEPMIALVDELRRWAEEQPLRLLGGLHASGAMPGVARLHERLATRFGPGATGLTYVTGPAPSSASSGVPVARSSNRQRLSRLALEEIADAARSFLAHVRAIVLALPLGEDRGQPLAQALNADAGAHEITCDPREIMAAIDAGLETWAHHPYYAARYGARGRRFTRSDSAWLVTLADLPERVRLERLEWLARLLAARGMPSLLLEDHLRHLHQALQAAVPERAARYDALEVARRALRERRLAVLPDFDALAASVPPHEVLGSLGSLVVAAVADERLGIQDAVASVEGWLAQSQRLGEPWVVLVREAIERARRS